MSKPIRLSNKKPVKRFIKTHPHKILYAIGGSLLSCVIVLGGLVWMSSNRLYAEQGAKDSGDYVSAVSQALAGAGGSHAGTSTSATQKSAQATPVQSAAKSTATSAQAQTGASSSAAVSAPAATQSSISNSNLHGLKLYVDPSRASLPSPLNSSSVANWFGNWNPDVQSAVNAVVSSSSASGSVPTLVAYDIPGRDCGSYSAGGADGSDAYKSWIRSFAAGIGNRQAIVILEPDALAQITCLDSAGQASRYALLSDAVSVLSSQTRAFTYLDAGNSNWIDASTMASRLNQANIAQATGFSLNVSNFETTANNTSFGNSVSSKVGGKHFVIDTGRNGNGPGSTWCNPSGRALGDSPSTSTSGNVDAYLWVKVPGESDGTCNGGPSAGTYWSDYAQSLIANRH